MNGDDRGEFSKDRLLRSWKEISAYLGCDVRTCHRWEDERGMPVHRAEGGGKRSQVFAYRDELDAWFRETFRNSSEAKSETKEEQGSRRSWLIWAAAGSVILIAAAAFFLLRARAVRRQPVDFHIVGSVFVALDENKKELWRRDLGFEDLQPESFYRERSQVKHPVYLLPLLIMKDIDADSDTEVLLALKRTTDSQGEGILFCFDRSGVKRWTYSCQRELRSPNKIFAADYRIYGIDCRDIDGDGRQEIFVESYHAPDWPCQLAVLNSSGTTIGEFWNAGYLTDLTFHDINGDGRDELIICGANNEYRGGCLIVFDPRNIAGGSPQSGNFVLDGLGPGSMLYYVTTPCTDVALALRHAVDSLKFVAITKSNWIEAMGFIGVMYDFDFELRCIQASFGNNFKMDYFSVHGGAFGRVPDGYGQRLVDGIRYWDGSAWVAEPTPVKR